MKGAQECGSCLPDVGAPVRGAGQDSGSVRAEAGAAVKGAAAVAGKRSHGGPVGAQGIEHVVLAVVHAHEQPRACSARCGKVKLSAGWWTEAVMSRAGWLSSMDPQLITCRIHSQIRDPVAASRIRMTPRDAAELRVTQVTIQQGSIQ